jgi:Phosphoglycerate dehydrogenase and related dehydrogenases
MKVLVDMPLFAPGLEALRRVPGVEVVQVEKPEEKKRLLPTALVQDCDVLFCTFPPENLGEMQQLKLIQISSAGYTQLLGLGLPEKNIRACNALGVFDVPIAEWNMAMMVNMARDMRTLLHHQDEKIWDRSARFQHEIRGSVVGIWGYGGIGRETARLAKAMGLTVHVLTRTPVGKREDTYCVPGTGDPDGVLPDRNFLLHEKESFLKGLDFLILAMPLTPENEGIVGEEELNSLPPGAFLLNPARGVLVKEQALIKALKDGAIKGAALDTHYYYPMPPGHPFWSMPNVILTPHISGSSASPNFLQRAYDILVQNVTRLQEGRSLLNELHPSKLVI